MVFKPLERAIKLGRRLHLNRAGFSGELVT
jgi:hypothetical protein